MSTRLVSLVAIENAPGLLAESHCRSYFHDCHSCLGVILWELNTCKKPFDGLGRDTFYEHVVHGGERPPINKKWPADLISLVCDCWSEKPDSRPTFKEIVRRIDEMLSKEKGGGVSKMKNPLGRLSGMIDRHSTWF